MLVREINASLCWLEKSSDEIIKRKGGKYISNLVIILGGILSQFQVFDIIVNNLKKAEQIGG